ncbi:MAG: hypothetical protein UY50_C0021G0002 [Parcubacteria group bacterium GW2011_GWA2_49_9]|nr:MAG: hypothetical protein UY50_C0021G0002 [Parcubacteria group bacterium GW2011_GWA2_49_9]
MKISKPDKKNRALEIVRAAKTDRTHAERLTLAYVQDINPKLGAKTVTILESKLSLNSVIGRITTNNRTYFFKFHAEENETETLNNTEYYNAQLLSDLGLPMILPIFKNSEPGSQFVLYDYITAPTAFDKYEEQELRYFETGTYDTKQVRALLSAESKLCRKIQDAYQSSLELTKSVTVARASLNQLFFTRLAGTGNNPPRLELYYLNQTVTLPDRTSVPFNELMKMYWVINGIRYEETLDDLIEKAKDLLDPRKEALVPTVIGHGDDHNGNKFFVGDEFLSFDPAFAGRQQALLSFVKSTVHNTLLHPFWRYDPNRLEGKLEISVAVSGNEIRVSHNWETEKLSPLRIEILNLYAKEVWVPLIQELTQKGWLPSYWKEYLRAAFFCCPFLVKNLIDPKVYTPPQSLLALAKCVEIGSKSLKETAVEKFLASIEKRL